MTKGISEQFFDAKTKYQKLRKQEQAALRDYLDRNGYHTKRCSCGKTMYSSGHTLQEPFDLSNWIWLDTCKEGVNFLITFQPYEIDPNSHNMHILHDRIGVYAYTEKYRVEKAISNMYVTGFELRLNADNKRELLKILEQYILIHKFKIENGISNDIII